MDAVAQGLGRFFGRIGQFLTLVFVGLLAGLSSLALGTKAVVLVPALFGAYAMLIIPYSPLYVIAATNPLNLVIAGPITVIRLAIVFGLLVAIIQSVKNQAPKPHIPMPEGVLPFCMFVWMFFATIVASEGDMVNRLGGFFVYAMVFFMLLIYTDTLDRMRNVLLTMIAVGVFQGLLVVLEAFFGIVPLGGLQADLAAESGAEEVRVVGASAHPIFLASFFMVVMTFAILLMSQAKNGVVKLFYLGILGLFALGWIKAWSRSSWIGMLVMIFVAMLLWTRTTRILALIGGTIGFVILAIHNFSMAEVIQTVDSFRAIQRGSTTAGVSDSGQSFSWRTENWYAAVSIWASNPIFGVGIDTVHSYMLDHLPPGAMGHRFVQAAIPHNMFLQTLAETGLPGFLMFTGCGFPTFMGVLRAWSVEILRPYAFAIFVVMCGQLTTYMFNPIPREIWFSLAMGLVLGRFARKHKLGETIT